MKNGRMLDLRLRVSLVLTCAVSLSTTPNHLTQVKFCDDSLMNFRAQGPELQCLLRVKEDLS